MDVRGLPAGIVTGTLPPAAITEYRSAATRMFASDTETVAGNGANAA
jgi:hypothetical protein